MESYWCQNAENIYFGYIHLYSEIYLEHSFGWEDEEQSAKYYANESLNGRPRKSTGRWSSHITLRYNVIQNFIQCWSIPPSARTKICLGCHGAMIPTGSVNISSSSWPVNADNLTMQATWLNFPNEETGRAIHRRQWPTCIRITPGNGRSISFGSSRCYLEYLSTRLVG
jgi:hypothetical protein